MGCYLKHNAPGKTDNLSSRDEYRGLITIFVVYMYIKQAIMIGIYYFTYPFQIISASGW